MRLPTLLLALALFACSGSASSVPTGSTSSTTDPTFDANGSWTGEILSSTGQHAAFTADMTEAGGTIGGTVHAVGACIGGGKIEGTTSGDRIEAKVVAGDAVATLHLTVTDGDHVDGTYVMPAVGACVGDTGSVSMTRQ